MPQLAPIVLKDNSGVDHTFVPQGAPGGVATLVESTGVPIADKKISISQTRTANGRRKTLIKVQLPVVQDMVVGGVSRPTAIRTAYAELTLSTDATSNPGERGDLTAYIKSFLLSAFGGEIAVLLEDVY